jgi:tetratricopeptide (TPR) repeat protein
VLKAQGKTDEAEAMIRRLAEDRPDYLFARTAMANICIDEGELDEAKEWLDPLLTRQHFHISEFRSLAFAQIRYWYAMEQPDGARHWVEMLEQVDPDKVPDAWREANEMLDLLNKLKDIDELS